MLTEACGLGSFAVVNRDSGVIEGVLALSIVTPVLSWARLSAVFDPWHDRSIDLLPYLSSVRAVVIGS